MVKEFNDEKLNNVTGGAQVISYSRFDKNDVFKDNRLSNRYIVIKETVDIPEDKRGINIVQCYEGAMQKDGKVHVADMKVLGTSHNLIVSWYTLTSFEVVFN